MKNKFTTACGFAALALNGMSAIATTATNENIAMYSLPISNANVLPIESPSNYFPIEQHEHGLTVSDIIQHADKTLGLSKQHLAKIFLISRQNLYNLLNNPDQKPNQETESRAKQVNEALKVVSAIFPHKLGASTLTVRIDNKRLFDVLTENSIDLEQVKKFSVAIAKRINKQSQPTLPEHAIKREEFLNRPNAV